MLEDLGLKFGATWYAQRDTSERATLQGVRVADVGGFAESQEVVTVNSAAFTFEQRGIQAAVSARYVLSGHSSVIGRYRYHSVQASGNRLTTDTFWDNHTLTIGFQYDFEPFRF
jgi:hypothetical protein